MQHDESLVNMLERLVVIEDAQQEILNRIAINDNEVDTLTDKVRRSMNKNSKSKDLDEVLDVL